MRKFIYPSMLMAAVVACGECQGVEPRELAVGGWSKPVVDTRGYAVRGRLVLQERVISDERREVAVYVELQDASEHVGGAMRLLCDLGKSDFRPESKSGLSCELRNEKRENVAPTSFAFGGATPKSEWLLLPSDATIRLRASPFGIYRAGAMAISPSLRALWIVADDDPGEYFLSGSFTIDPEEGRRSIEDPHIWRGTLELPEVRIVGRNRPAPAR